MIAELEPAIARVQLPFADSTYKMEMVGVGRVLMRLHETGQPLLTLRGLPLLPI